MRVSRVFSCSISVSFTSRSHWYTCVEGGHGFGGEGAEECEGMLRRVGVGGGEGESVRIYTYIYVMYKYECAYIYM